MIVGGGGHLPYSCTQAYAQGGGGGAKSVQRGEGVLNILKILRTY